MRDAVTKLTRAAGLPFRLLAIGLLRGYRAVGGGALGGRCRFHPSCSAYAIEAVRTHGAIKGMLLAAWRVGRCSPLSVGGPDPVPRRGAWRPSAYDSVTRGAES